MLEMMTDEKTPEVVVSVPLPLKTLDDKLVGKRVQRESGGLRKKEKKNGERTLMQLVITFWAPQAGINTEKVA